MIHQQAPHWQLLSFTQMVLFLELVPRMLLSKSGIWRNVQMLQISQVCIYCIVIYWTFVHLVTTILKQKPGFLYAWKNRTFVSPTLFPNIFPGHSGAISSIAFSENGYYLATAAEDSTVRLWDLRKLKNFKTIQLDEGYEVTDLSFDQSGTYLAVAGTDVRWVLVLHVICCIWLWILGCGSSFKKTPICRVLRWWETLMLKYEYIFIVTIFIIDNLFFKVILYWDFLSSECTCVSSGMTWGYSMITQQWPLEFALVSMPLTWLLHQWTEHWRYTGHNVYDTSWKL